MGSLYYTMRGIRGLGALPALPPPVAGKEWWRYLKSPDVQWTSCPPNPPYGCVMSGGYAWGQRTYSGGTGEFNFVYIEPVPTSQTSTGTPMTRTEIDAKCFSSLRTWISNNSALAACLTDADWDKINAWCVAWWQGTMPNYVEARDQLAREACAYRECEQMYVQWAQAFPAEAACIDRSERETLQRICVQGKLGVMSATEVDRQLRSIIDSACADVVSPPSGSTSPLPPTVAPPSGGATVPLPPGAPEVVDPTDEPSFGPEMLEPSDGIPYGGDYEIAPTDGSKSSVLRQLGPIVGIGLLVAVGLTVARKKRPKRGGRRK